VVRRGGGVAAYMVGPACRRRSASLTRVHSGRECWAVAILGTAWQPQREVERVWEDEPGARARRRSLDVE
jgi:hypothetical protein